MSKLTAKEYRDSWYQQNKETILAKRKLKYKQDPEHRQRCLAGNKRRWTERRDKYTKRSRDTHLRRTYGITEQQELLMLEQQQHKCAICSKLPKLGAKLNVDHNHKTGAVRALLCINCNMTLGLMHDSEEALLNAAAYLKKHAAQT